MAKTTNLMGDNQTTSHVACNPETRVRVKYIELDCHLIRENLKSKHITTRFDNLNEQLANIFTKSLRRAMIDHVCSKLSIYNLYTPT